MKTMMKDMISLIIPFANLGLWTLVLVVGVTGLISYLFGSTISLMMFLVLWIILTIFVSIIFSI